MACRIAYQDVMAFEIMKTNQFTLIGIGMQGINGNVGRRIFFIDQVFSIQFQPFTGHLQKWINGFF
jgi:hypothetical protein